MAQDSLVGFTEETAGRILDVTRFVESDPRYTPPARVRGGPPSREPILMLALADFALAAYSSEGDTYLGDYDSHVALCVPLERNIDASVETTGIPSRLTYFPGGEAVPVHAAINGRSGNVSGCSAKAIKCGARLWVIWSPWSERWEVVSLDDEFAGGSSCNCTWGGWALWKVTAGPVWTLDENHCVGCSADLDAVQDLRFSETTDETSLVEPTMDPPSSWIGTDKRYVTCCGATDVPPECPSCCYSLSFPVPKCGGGSDGTKQIVLSGGGGGLSCIWTSGDYQALLTGIACTEWTTTSTRNISIRASMFGATNYLFIWVRFATPDGEVTIQARYVVTGDIDCDTSLTAALDVVTTIGTGEWECTECALDPVEFFPDSLDVTLATSCDTTTTSTTTTTTTSTSTTGDPGTTTTTTTSTTTTTTTTAAPTTTTTSTTTGSTTGEPTTTTTTTSTTTTTAAPCSGDCNYIAVSGATPTGWAWSGNGNSCSGSGCGCPSNLETPTSILGYPTFEGQTGSIPCDTDYP